MKYVTKHWKVRSVIIMSVSLVVCAILWTLSLSEWAAEMNSAVTQAHDKPDISAIALGLVSLLKVTLMILIPGGLTLAITSLYKKLTLMIKTTSKG
ncbi:hypothetical protein DBZ36_05325 [Alginatibacterium sediminis]|uniref:Uncharacterized protein n=1 Tax=Alginatibacterium sediminis TaxID=2164068 RepID=A0A420EGU1_9ALTE|nr:hypothetical protein [Alginatibacterium sediminis]RKF19880.1 hypothetical protein DBZ36_05325 [Alginatibacterium sediminis]